MRLNVQSISLWLGVLFGAVMLAAFVAFPGFFPPMSPTMSADEVAKFYADHRGAIRLSMCTFNFCGVMLVPFFMVIVYQMKRMATPTQVFAYSYLSAVIGGVTLFALRLGAGKGAEGPGRTAHRAGAACPSLDVP